MQKKNAKKIILILVLGLCVYVLPVIGIFSLFYFSEQDKTFEMKDNIIEISKGKLIIKDATSYYDEEDDTYYIIGYLKNKTENSYDSISLEYRVYDKEGNILGNAMTYLEELEANKSWKFKAIYSEIDASEIDSFEFSRIDYY